MTRKEQKENTRLRIIEAGCELFAKAGIQATSTAQIAARLNLSHGAVFVHFPNRDSLVQTIVDDFGEKLAAKFYADAPKQPDLKSLLMTHLEIISEYEDFYFRLITESQLLPKSVRGTLFVLNSIISHRIYELAEPLINEGRMTSLTQAEIFNTWLALVHHTIMNREYFSNQTPILTSQKHTLTERFLKLTLIPNHHPKGNNK